MAKFCSNCGAQMEDNVMFCASCGNPCAANPQPQQPVYQPMYQQPPMQMRNPVQSGANNSTIRIAVIILAAIMLFSLLLPLYTASEEYSELLEQLGDYEVFDGMAAEDLGNLNVFEFITILGDENSEYHYDGAQGIITVVVLLGLALTVVVLIMAIAKKYALSAAITIPSIIVVNLSMVLMDLNEETYSYGFGFYFFMLAAVATIVLSIVCIKQDKQSKQMAYTQQWGMQ